ncbi:hypothetical protein FHG87_015214 [Trinorchestia longiramus]|nr:hypothetical protein FHG87_015214 [Trinorchestia longiramus]
MNLNYIRYRNIRIPDVERRARSSAACCSASAGTKAHLMRFVMHKISASGQTGLGPDWNPRSLSTFSTFGGSSSPLCNGRNDGPLLNGHTPPIMSAHHPPDGATTPTNPPPSLHQASPLPTHITNGRPDVMPRTRAPTPAIRTVPVPAPLPPPSHSHSRSLVGLSSSPTVIPQHSHSRSLVGVTPSPTFVPHHSHSRSLLDSRELQDTPDPSCRVVTLFLGASDRRFGFSVVGGIDDLLPARIDDIAVGTQAEECPPESKGVGGKEAMWADTEPIDVRVEEDWRSSQRRPSLVPGFK